MHNNFYGVYASYIEELVELKRSLGFKYISGEFVLTVFDKFSIERNETSVGITKESYVPSSRGVNMVDSSFKFLLKEKDLVSAESPDRGLGMKA